MNETDLDALPPDDPIDLLERGVFTLDDEERSVVSLAELFARLGQGEPTELAYLMPHQRHAMHAFVVQLMAMVARRSGDARLDREAREWRDALRVLAGSAEAFQLVVADLAKPAFLQPPVPEGTLDKFKPVETPDALDLLVLAKNHDVKMARIRHPRIEHWVFSLISLQTHEGYGGAGNYGIARMNSGRGTRPCFGVAPSLAWPTHVRRDVLVACSSQDPPPVDYSEPGLSCVWVEPWDGVDSIPLTKLDQFFVEICRRIRISRESNGLSVMRGTSKARRLDADAFLGNVGDLWTPVEVERGAALTLTALDRNKRPKAALSYSRIAEVLFDERWRRPLALRVSSEDGDQPVALARALVRDQGKTQGLHERTIFLPKKTRVRIATADGRMTLGKLSKERVESAGVLRKVLHHALCAYLQGGADKLNFDDNRADSHLDAVDDAIDAEFFPRLFEDVDLDSAAASRSFEAWLFQLGRDALERAFDSLPTAAARRERAIASAEARFFGGVRKNLPNADRASPARPETDRSTREETADDR